MDNVSERLQGLILSAIEIRELTGWDDAMVEDYLNIIRNLIEIATSLDGSDSDIVNNRQLISLNLGSISKLKSLIQHQGDLLKSIVALSVDNNKLRVRINLQSKELINLQQSIVDDNQARVRNNQQNKDIQRVEQLAVGW